MDGSEDIQTDMKNFVKNFKTVNYSMYKEPIFDKKSLIWFTDGSCIKNGKTNSSAGYASSCVNGFKKGLIIYGKLDDKLIKATNIRAEGMAIQSVFENVIKNNKSSDWNSAVIYTDSEFWVKMIYNYMPK